MNLKIRFTMLAAAVSICGTLSAQEKEISRREVPPSVLAAFDKAYPNAKVLEWEKEIHSGKLYYEAETVDGKISRNILYLPDGAVVQIEEKMMPKDLPAAVTEAVKRQYPNATIRSAAKITRGDVPEYTLDLKGVNERKIVMHADGTIVR